MNEEAQFNSDTVFLKIYFVLKILNSEKIYQNSKLLNTVT